MPNNSGICHRWVQILGRLIKQLENKTRQIQQVATYFGTINKETRDIHATYSSWLQILGRLTKQLESTQNTTGFLKFYLFVKQDKLDSFTVIWLLIISFPPLTNYPRNN